MEDLKEDENLLNHQDLNIDSDSFATTDNRNGNSKVIAGVADFEEFDDAKIKGAGTNEKLDFLKDLQLNVYIELGRTQMQIKEILELERGYVIELDKLASEPVDIYVNNKKIAEGEVVVIDKHFGIRITNLNDASSRLKGLY
ncbi:MAG TPA: flagellar motor switch protein FliN [Ignavibacteriaceae bacterium]|nr:flagellar motor switch protein FliN [Ignavibacteriaceae bacterium]